MATLSPVTFTAAAPTTRSSGRTTTTTTKITYIKGLNSFSGLKAYNTQLSALGTPLCTEQHFANVVSKLNKPSSRVGGGGGGALTSTCNAVGEIFRIAAIMNGLTLVGVAIGFVLLRIEAAVEESD